MVKSLNGWEAPAPNLKTFDIPGTKRRVTLDATAGRVLVALAADYHKTVRAIDIGPWDEGGYNNRDARMAAGKASNHASGSALDLNWSEEGAMGSAWGKKFFAQAKTKAAIAILKRRYGSVLQWGGDWRAQDFMHWEIKPGVTKVDVLALCQKLGIDKNGVRRGTD